MLPSGGDQRPSGGRRRLLLLYYLATPGFLLLDLSLGVNLRTTFFDGVPPLKVSYYAIALGCGVAVARWPRHAGLVGLVESGANISLLVLGAGLAYLRLVDAALSDVPLAAGPFTSAGLLNLVVSAVVLVVSYVEAQSRFFRGRS